MEKTKKTKTRNILVRDLSKRELNNLLALKTDLNINTDAKAVRFYLQCYGQNKDIDIEKQAHIDSLLKENEEVKNELRIMQDAIDVLFYLAKDE